MTAGQTDPVHNGHNFRHRIAVICLKLGIHGQEVPMRSGTTIARLFPHELQDEEAYILAPIRKGERIEQYETVRQRKDGRRVPCFNAAALSTGQKSPPRGRASPQGKGRTLQVHHKHLSFVKTQEKRQPWRSVWRLLGTRQLLTGIERGTNVASPCPNNEMEAWTQICRPASVRSPAINCSSEVPEASSVPSTGALSA